MADDRAEEGSRPGRILYLLLVFVPVAVSLDMVGGPAVAIFFAAALGVVPCAVLMDRATQTLADRSGPAVGGLLNVTFGNAPELIIAIVALAKGLQGVVKGSLVGSVAGNLLLVLGTALLVGGVGRREQTFHRQAAMSQAAMLIVLAAAVGLVAVAAGAVGEPLPGLGVEAPRFSGAIEGASAAASLIMIVTYACGLILTMGTHRKAFSGVGLEGDAPAPKPAGDRCGIVRAVVVLAVSGALVAVTSEALVGSIEPTAERLGLSDFFISFVIVAIVGNAAEHWVAVSVARRDSLDLSLNIGIGSAAQIGLFVLPVLVLLSFAVGAFPMALVLNPIELAAVAVACGSAVVLASRGRSNWFSGVQLLALYALLVATMLFAD